MGHSSSIAFFLYESGNCVINPSDFQPRICEQCSDRSKLECISLEI